MAEVLHLYFSRMLQYPQPIGCQRLEALVSGFQIGPVAQLVRASS